MPGSGRENTNFPFLIPRTFSQSASFTTADILLEVTTMASNEALQAAKKAALTELLENGSTSIEGSSGTIANDVSVEEKCDSNDVVFTTHTKFDGKPAHQAQKTRTRPRRKRRRVEAACDESSHLAKESSSNVVPHVALAPDITGTVDEHATGEKRNEAPSKKSDMSEAPTSVEYVLEPVMLPELSDVTSMKVRPPGDVETRGAGTVEAETGQDVDDVSGSEALAELRAALARFDARTSTILNTNQPDVDEDPTYPDFSSLLPSNSQTRPAVEGIDDENAEVGRDDDDANENGESTGVVSDEDHEDSGGEPSTEGLSRKKRKEARRELVSVLKATCPDPSVVDPWDVTANDPLLLCTLKAVRNSVPVPLNWRQKRKYLQNKRGLSKRVLPLPPTIEALGIGATRDAQLATDSRKSLKQRQRERMRAKTGAAIGAADVDDRRLRQAFRQLGKPPLSALGDVYFELKELEVDPRSFVPGTLSDELRNALGMQKNDPPPWIVAMQRWGPPPGWPGLRVPGVNAPIPAGARFGYQAGGWGKPAVDQTGRPLYGDVFGQGLIFEVFDDRFDVSHETKTRRWGDVQAVQEPPNDEQVGSVGDEEEGFGQRDSDEIGAQDSGTLNASLNDKTRNEGVRNADEASVPRPGYHVLKERREWSGGNGLMASSHVYDMDGANKDNEQYRQGDETKREKNRNEGGYERDGDGRHNRTRETYKTQRFKF